MKITPISQKTEFVSMEQARHSSLPFSKDSSSSCCSSFWSCHWLGTCTKAVFHGISKFFQWVFCWTCCYGASKQSESIRDDTPAPVDAVKEMTPEERMQDPFICMALQEVEEGVYAPKNEGAAELIWEIFDISANKLPWQATINVLPFYTYNEIVNKKNRQLKDEHLHPLASLYIMVMNESRVRLLHTFETNVSNWSTAVAGVCNIVGHPEPWREVFTQQAKVFIKWEGDILSLVPGFCKFLSLDEAAVKSYVDREDWEHLVEYVYLERKKQFEIS